LIKGSDELVAIFVSSRKTGNETRRSAIGADKSPIDN
jgi:hypothetical protein